MKNKKSYGWAFVIFFAAANAAAQNQLTPDEKRALDQVHQLMTSPTEREDAVKQSPKAKAVDQSLNKLTNGNPQTNQKVYEAASKIFQQMVTQTGGDPTKLQNALESGQKDPQTFFESLPADQREAIRKIASEIEGSPAAKP